MATESRRGDREEYHGGNQRPQCEAPVEVVYPDSRIDQVGRAQPVRPCGNVSTHVSSSPLQLSVPDDHWLLAPPPRRLPEGTYERYLPAPGPCVGAGGGRKVAEGAS